MRFSALFLTALLGGLMGCSSLPPESSLHWSPFEGDQETWPTQEFGLMHARDGFPIYHLSQCPADAYEVLGYIQAASNPLGDVAEDERAVVQLARQQGGEAVLVSKETPVSKESQLRHTDYLVIKFKPRSVATAIENIDIFLALTAGITNDYSGIGPRGVPVHFNAQQLADERQDMIQLKARLQSSPEFQRPPKPQE